jgi:hypothetical protein
MEANAMSVRKNIDVRRTYRPEPDDCTRALTLLLKKSANKEAARPRGPDDAKESRGVCTATEQHT